MTAQEQEMEQFRGFLRSFTILFALRLTGFSLFRSSPTTLDLRLRIERIDVLSLLSYGDVLS